VAGLALISGSVMVAAKLVLVWILALISSALSCYLIGRSARVPDADPSG